MLRFPALEPFTLKLTALLLLNLVALSNTPRHPGLNLIRVSGLGDCLAQRSKGVDNVLNVHGSTIETASANLCQLLENREVTISEAYAMEDHVCILSHHSLKISQHMACQFGRATIRKENHATSLPWHYQFFRCCDDLVIVYVSKGLESSMG